MCASSTILTVNSLVVLEQTYSTTKETTDVIQKSSQIMNAHHMTVVMSDSQRLKLSESFSVVLDPTIIMNLFMMPLPLLGSKQQRMDWIT